MHRVTLYYIIILLYLIIIFKSYCKGKISNSNVKVSQKVKVKKKYSLELILPVCSFV